MSDIRLRRTSNRSIPFRPVDRRCLAYVWTLTKNCPETGCRAITKPICIVRKLCVGQVAAIIAALQCANASDLEVHDMRTELQRSRAMLRVLRPYLGNRAYHKENIALRDTARLLTPVRDAKVLVQTAREFRRDDDISAVRQFYGRVVGELTAEWRERQRLQKPISTNFNQFIAQGAASTRVPVRRALGWNKCVCGSGARIQTMSKKISTCTGKDDRRTLA
jgi:hypothetical protein